MALCLSSIRVWWQGIMVRALLRMEARAGGEPMPAERATHRVVGELEVLVGPPRRRVRQRQQRRRRQERANPHASPRSLARSRTQDALRDPRAAHCRAASCRRAPRAPRTALLFARPHTPPAYIHRASQMHSDTCRHPLKAFIDGNQCKTDCYQ